MGKPIGHFWRRYYQSHVTAGIRCNIMSFNIVSCNMVFCNMVSCNMVFCNMVSCNMVSCNMVSCNLDVAFFYFTVTTTPVEILDYVCDHMSVA
ncbi:hypothetical protein AVEN_134874-1 [Araneus ventricosus]|uniref:Uncharacterized protein n=1 Tax=Araneus ventricosus TaxID=182803 RepID=A0A4Y2UB30_ARAVE|nr:hypothetical protein AVEN_134874-1 [Araneus ventricosus]